MKIEDYEAYDLLSKFLPNICRLQISTIDNETSIIISIRERDRLVYHDIYLDFFFWISYSELRFTVNENRKTACTDFLLLSSMSDIVKYFNQGSNEN